MRVAVAAVLLVATSALAGEKPGIQIPVAVVVQHGEFEDKATEDLEKLAKKFRERLVGGKVKLAVFTSDPDKATVVVKLLSKEWQATGNATTRATGLRSSRTVAETAFGVFGVLLAGESEIPFNLRLDSSQIFNKDNTLSGMLDKHVEDFLKRNQEKLVAPEAPPAR